MKVSAIIPLYQKKAWVLRALDSVAGQSRAPDEVIVVDDGSSDGGAELVAARAGADVRLIRQAHAGEGAARNRGLEAAQGEWVALLDADDEWRPDFLEATLAEAARSPQVVGVFSNILEGGTGRPLLGAGGGGPLADYFAFVLAQGLGMTSSTLLARRQALLSCGGFPTGVPVGADGDAWARLAWSGPVAYVPRPLAAYHHVPDSATARARAARPCFPAAVRSYRRWRRAGRIPKALLKSSARLAERMLLDHAAALLNQGRRGPAARILASECSWKGPRFWSLVLRLGMPAQVQAALRGLRTEPVPAWLEQPGGVAASPTA